MNEYLIYALVGLLFLVAGILIMRFLSGVKLDSLIKDFENEKKILDAELNSSKDLLLNQKTEHSIFIEKLENDFKTRLKESEDSKNQIQNEKETINSKWVKQTADYENLVEKLETQKEEVKELQQKFQKEFENLANKILDQKSEKFTSLNKQNIENILNPLKEKIEGFEKKVSDSEIKSAERHSKLDEQLKTLNEQNQKISEEAVNLTRALKGNTKMQGNWGEMILERVLEMSGLQKDKEYKVQQSYTNEDGHRIQPDVVVFLPGEKKMIIDSKVSLNAYERFVNSAEENERNQNLKEHLLSIKKHVDELSQKKYQTIYETESPDFVLLFIPIEAAFAAASNENPNLYSDAFVKKIIIVTPTTLLAVLKTIDSMWQNERQSQNALEIARQAGRLYDSFVNLIDEFEKVGKQLGTVQGTYENAMKKLTGKGNLVGRVEKLRELGAKTSKQIDQRLIDEYEENQKIEFDDEN